MDAGSRSSRVSFFQASSASRRIVATWAGSLLLMEASSFPLGVAA
jgi:hypothetical protein